MALARRTEPDPLNIAVVARPSLPAAPGSEELFAEIYARMLPAGIDHAARFLSESEARDAVADALAEVWQRWDHLSIEQRSAAYCLGAIHHHIIKRLRDNKRLVALEDAESELSHLAIHEIDAPEHAVTAAEIIDRVVEAMPPRRREVFLLIRELGYTYKEVCELLSVSEGTVNSHMLKAGEAIRAAFERRGYALAAGRNPMLTSRTVGKEAADA